MKTPISMTARVFRQRYRAKPPAAGGQRPKTKRTTCGMLQSHNDRGITRADSTQLDVYTLPFRQNAASTRFVRIIRIYHLKRYNVDVSRWCSLLLVRSFRRKEIERSRSVLFLAS